MNQSPKQLNTRYSELEKIRSIDDNSKEFVFLHTCEGGIINFIEMSISERLIC